MNVDMFIFGRGEEVSMIDDEEVKLDEVEEI